MAVERISRILEGWDGRFHEESTEATAYSFVMLFFYKSLMHNYYEDEDTRMKIVDNYNFVDFIERVILEEELGITDVQHNKICKGAYPEYKQQDFCSHNLAMAFVKTNDQLHSLGSNTQWSKLHFNEYSNMPWSKTPLKFLFHRDVPTFGTTNSPHVSKVSYRRASTDMFFASTHVAGLKMIVAHAPTAKEGTNLFSCDTGVNGDYFSKHYFNMNESHLKGELQEMLIGGQVQKVKHSVLVIQNWIKRPNYKPTVEEVNKHYGITEDQTEL